MEISMKASTRTLVIAVAVVTGVALSSGARTQPIHASSSQEGQIGAAPMPGHDPSAPRPGEMAGMMQKHGQETMENHAGMMEMHARHAAQMAGAAPTLAGQDAFGALQEIVRKLEADPNTDWSKINLEALRAALKLP
jgi:hypothetical protein